MTKTNFPIALSRRHFLAIAGAGGFIGGFIAFPASGSAGSLSAEEFTERLGTWVVRLAASGHDDARLKQEFIRLFSAHVDIHALADFALGKYRRRMPENIRSEYRALVLDYVAAMFVQHRRRLAAHEVKARGKRRSGKWLLVESALVYPNGKASPVRWRLINTSRGYQVADVNLRNVWLSLRMRDNFVAILDRSRGDFATLLQKLRRNAA